MSLRVLGTLPWLLLVGGMMVVAVVAARSRYGWMLNIVLQLAVLPRVLLVNLALLLAAPLPRRAATQATTAPAARPE